MSLSPTYYLVPLRSFSSVRYLERTLLENACGNLDLRIGALSDIGTVSVVEVPGRGQVDHTLSVTLAPPLRGSHGQVGLGERHRDRLLHPLLLCCSPSALEFCEYIAYNRPGGSAISSLNLKVSMSVLCGSHPPIISSH